ncbi:hypothetical protein BC826DRAFT_1190373 [Russula brevipes]|nr:hypothetical protein BC826DRAFT_1190373 [Russula brevipes]
MLYKPLISLVMAFAAASSVAAAVTPGGPAVKGGDDHTNNNIKGSSNPANLPVCNGHVECCDSISSPNNCIPLDINHLENCPAPKHPACCTSAPDGGIPSGCSEIPKN